MRVFALDLSLTRTGWADADGNTGTIIPPRGFDSGMKRLAWIRDDIMGRLSDDDLIVIEGYSFGQARGTSNLHALGELGGVMRLALWDAGDAYIDIPPASLKKYATGKGNANKELVLVEAVKRLRYAGADNNEADALWLRAMAMDYYGVPVVTVPAVHREALEKAPWPKLLHNDGSARIARAS